MTDYQKVAGGVHTPANALVSADQVTILGDGTADKPLHSPGAPSAAAIVNAGGTFAAQFGFSAVASEGAGTLLLTLTSPPADPDQQIPVITVVNVGAGPSVAIFENVPGGQVRVFTYNSAGVLTNRTFSIAVFAAPLVS